MAYKVAWTSAAKRSLQKLPEKVGHAVIELIYGPLAGNPQQAEKSLRLQLGGLHGARRGDFRIIYRIDEANTRIDILAIEHRSEVYRPR